MSRDYHLVCFDCRVYLHMGKVYWIGEDGNPLDDVTFDGIVEQNTGRTHKRDEYFGRVVEKFLILHRNHELRFVPEGVDEFLEDSIGLVNEVEGDDLIAAKVEPEVNWWREREQWQAKLNFRGRGRVNGLHE